MDPRFYYARWNLGVALQLKGQLSEAIAEYRKAVELNNDPGVLALLGQAYARAGQREEGQKILTRLTDEAKSRYGTANAPGSFRLRSMQCLMISVATRASKRSCKKFSPRKNE
jgi:tetratricopeptide (TPR) repeat protein